jgi:hypothetical protein
MNTVFVSGFSAFMTAQCALMGETAGARQDRASGKYLRISRLTEWQQDDMTTCLSFDAIIRSYSRFTTVAPKAVSDAPLNPSRPSAVLMEPMETPSKFAEKDGATLAITVSPLRIMSLALGVSFLMLFVFRGHITKHLPHRTHSSVNISTRVFPAEKPIDLTGQCLMHL